jgi:uncharacterized protein involved in exopolysaccharide biosynthesis
MTDALDMHNAPVQGAPADDEGADMLDLATPIAAHWRSILGVTVAGGALALAATFLITPRFTAESSFIVPQQQGGATGALASLGALAGLGGAQRTQADQYVALMQSVTISDRVIDKFQLMQVYDTPLRFLAREKLKKAAAINAGKKDGLITVAVTDTSPQRAAAMANDYIEQLRAITATLAITEAQRRRMFFEKQMLDTKARLVTAQTELQSSGISEGTLKAEPRSAAEAYARLRAELTTTEVTLQTVRESMADTAPEVQTLAAKANALRDQIRSAERSDAAASSPPGYIDKYREFKYQETLFDLMAKQYELARVDEARDGTLIQVVDPAQPPEHKSSPRRLPIAVAAALACLVLYSGWIIARARWRLHMTDPAYATRWNAFRAAWRRR